MCSRFQRRAALLGVLHRLSAHPEKCTDAKTVWQRTDAKPFGRAAFKGVTIRRLMTGMPVCDCGSSDLAHSAECGQGWCGFQ